MPRTIHGGGELFEPTRWSVVLAAARTAESPEAAASALAAVCQTYWAPLYTFVRGRNYSPHDAQDLTQGFFAHLIEHKLSGRLDPRKGKFRSYLLASIKHYLLDARAREQAAKRGGRYHFMPPPESRAIEPYYPPSGEEQSVASGEDRAFEQAWAQALVDAALERVAAAYLAEDKQALFDALKPFISIGDAASASSYDGLVTNLEMPASTIRSHVTRLRARFRESLRAEVRRTVNTAAGVEEELRELIRVLTAR